MGFYEWPGSDWGQTTCLAVFVLVAFITLFIGCRYTLEIQSFAIILYSNLVLEFAKKLEVQFVDVVSVLLIWR